MIEAPLSPLNDPQAIFRNAKASQQALRDALKVKDPWDRDVEFHRQNTRRFYLQLLLSFPYAPHSQTLDNPMWIETSHAFIAIYRQRIATLERNVASRAERAAAASDASAQGKARKPESGPVELRKLIQRFRQFLADEEKFWSLFVLRVARSFALTEATPHLEALKLPAVAQSDDPSARRSLFPEEGAPMPPPKDQREKKLFVLVKALISLGDLARYREQYNESGGRPKAGHDDVPPRWATKATRKPGDQATRPRNYNRALACYAQAHLLFPDAGNASHQLAILASYQSDIFASILHYYRSLCVRLPFQMALENLDKTLFRALESYKSIPDGSTKDQETPRAIVDRFKREVVILHALWRSEKTDDNELAVHADHTLSQFNKLLSERLLPIGLVIKIYTAALGALWTLRMFSSSSRKPNKSLKQEKENAMRPNSALENIVLAHIMGLHLGLVRVAQSQLPEFSPDDMTPIAERITAVMRRLLQTLRVASRWVRANRDYLVRSANGVGPTSPLLNVYNTFWTEYARFLTSIVTVFPPSQLETKAIILEEDIELSGFAPLKGSLEKSNATIKSNEVHPNDEYLFRVLEIIVDAKAIASSESTPLRFQDEVFSSTLEQSFSAPLALIRQMSNDIVMDRPLVVVPSQDDATSSRPDDDEIASVSTEDPVTMAMRATMGDVEDDEEEDEEQILYPYAPRKPAPAMSPSLQALHMQSSAATRFPSHAPTMSTIPSVSRVQPMFESGRFGNVSLASQPPRFQDPFGGTIAANRPVFSTSMVGPPMGAGTPNLNINIPPVNNNAIGAGIGSGPMTPPFRMPLDALPSTPGVSGSPSGMRFSPTRLSPTSGTPLPRSTHSHQYSFSASPGSNIGVRQPSFDHGQANGPRTAQDLLMRVLGNPPPKQALDTNAGAHSSNQGHGPHLENTGARPPLLYGAGNGSTSIWAP